MTAPVSRFILLLIAAVFWSGGASGTAAGVRADFDAELRRLHCPGADALSEGMQLVLLSAWSGRSLVEMARKAGFSAEIDALGEDARLLPDDDDARRDMLDRMAEVAAGGVTALRRDIAAHGSKLCPWLAVTDGGFEDVLRQQLRANAPVRPYLATAQLIARLHGCYSGPLDGAFGPMTRAAWNRVAEAVLPDAVKTGKTFPAPGEVMRLATEPVASGACDSEQGQAAVPLYPLLFERAAAEEAVAAAEALAPGHLRNRAIARVVYAVMQYGDDANGVAVESKAAETVWRLASADFAGFVNDLPEETGSVYTDDIFFTLAQTLMFGIGTDPHPAESLVLLRKLAVHDGDARLFLAGLTRCGSASIPGLPRDGDAPCTAGDDPAFVQYEAIGSDPARAAQFLRDVFAREDAAAQDLGGEQASFSTIYADSGNWAQAARIARLAVRFPEAMAILAEQPPKRQFMFGQMLLEGRAGMEADRSLGVSLIARAAAAGEPDAALRFGHIRRFGSFGATPDPAEAERLYSLAAEAGSAEAAFAIADMHDTAGEASSNFAAARRWYQKAADLYLPEGGWDLGAALQDRIIAGSPFLQSGPGGAWLKTVAGKHAALAKRIADASLCTSCGGVIDIAAAADWYRRAASAPEGADADTALALARLLIARPDLAASKDEALGLLMRYAPEKPKGEGDDWYNANGWDALSYLLLRTEELRRAGAAPGETVRQMAAALDLACRIDQYEACRMASLEMATGRWPVPLANLGFAHLTTLVNAEGPVDEYAAAALADAYAAYGDYPDANALLRRIDRGGLEFTASLPLLRRLVAAHVRRSSSELPEGLTDYLRLLSLLGNEEAQGLSATLAESEEAAPLAPATPPPVDESRAALELQLSRGALGRGIVLAARQLSAAQERAGAKDEALRAELTSLSAELQLAAVDEITEGPLPSRLTRVCVLSRASERIASLGFDEAAVTVAKYAVNELQLARRDLSGLPERLRGCFRDIAADSYRHLADLFVRQGRLPEARFTMGLLKDFETYEFVGRDGGSARRSFDGFPFDALEDELTAAINGIALPLTARARWLAEMKWKARSSKLTVAEQAEMSKVEAELARASEAYRAQLDSAVAATKSLGRSDRASEIDSLKALQSFLRSNERGRTAALHYIVLPNRLQVILTTAELQISRTVDRMDGKAFDEQALDVKLDRFRAALQHAGDDPAPAAQDLYQILIGPLGAEIKAAGTKTLLISADRRLRYIPFAALHDGTGYLVEAHDIAALSDAGYEVAGDHRTGLPVNALGTTRGEGDFQPLPNVKSEVSGIVKAGGYGFLDGQVALDGDFTSARLKDALLFGPPGSGTLGVVHIASHFSLGDSDRTSRLLLGDGSLLSLADIKGDTFAYDFGSVDLLTLSACSTAFGLAQGDGRDIDSFAEISRRGGARAILASLWPVNDASTSILMQRFYELRERRNLGKAEALAAVQKEFVSGRIGEGDQAASVVFETVRRGAVGADDMEPAPIRLDGFKHPYYWAPFIMMGNWQ